MNDYTDYSLGALIKAGDIPAQENLAFAKANLEARESITGVTIEGLALWVKARKAKLKKGAK